LLGPPQVFNCSFKYFDTLAEVSEQPVASGAKQSTDFPGLVIMIHRKHANSAAPGSGPFRSLANCADSALRLVHRSVVGNGDPVQALKPLVSDCWVPGLVVRRCLSVLLPDDSHLSMDFAGAFFASTVALSSGLVYEGELIKRFGLIASRADHYFGHHETSTKVDDLCSRAAPVVAGALAG